MKRFFIAPFIAVALIGGWLTTAGAEPPQGKSVVCHVAGNQGKIVKISVSNSALPAHLAHGDQLADEYGECV